MTLIKIIKNKNRPIKAVSLFKKSANLRQKLQILKEIISFIISNNKGREIFNRDFTNCFHT